MAFGIILRVSHTGKSGGSVLIDDILDGSERYPNLFSRAGANYVPLGGFVDLAYGGLVAASYERGQIRKFIDEGYLTASFLFGPDFISALPGVGLHAPTHVDGGIDEIDGDLIDITFNPTNYVPDDSIVEANDVDDLAAHLKGIDDAIGSGGGGGSTKLSRFQFNQNISIPENSILFLKNGETVTSASPLVFGGDGTLEGLTISVDTADLSGDYNFHVLINGSIVETTILGAGSTTTVDISYSSAFSSGDQLSIYAERRTGAAAKSIFDEISVIIFFSLDLPTGLSRLQFNRNISVPENSGLYLKNGDTSTSAAPLIFKGSGTLRGATISVDTLDTVRSYDIDFIINSIVRETLVLPASSLTSVNNSFSYSFNSGDSLEVFISRSSGALLKSDFDQMSVVLFFDET